MEPSAAYYREFLRTELTRRCRKNPRYSLRAFAKGLAVDVAALSRVLAGKGALSLKTAERVVKSLECTAQAKRLFLDSVAKDLKRRALGKVAPELPPAEAEVLPLADSAFERIADWHHFALLELTFTKRFVANPRWIARRLGITEVEAQESLDLLLGLGLLSREGDKVKKTNRAIHSKSKAGTSEALRRHQRQLAAKAERSVEGVAPPRRAVTTVLVPTDPKLIESARQMIEDFAWQVSRHLCAGSYEEVYALTINLFPLTQEEGCHAKS